MWYGHMRSLNSESGTGLQSGTACGHWVVCEDPLMACSAGCRLQIPERSISDDACRQVLPAYWFGDWHWAGAHVLCLVGAVLGSIGSFALQAHANRVIEGGAPTWLVS